MILKCDFLLRGTLECWGNRFALQPESWGSNLSVLVFYCCLSNTKWLKTTCTYYLTVSTGQKSRQGLTVSSVQGLTRLKSRYQLDCVPFLSSGSSSKLAESISRRLMSELLSSLLAVGQGPLLATATMLSCLPHDASISFQDMTAGFFKARKRISCFDFLSPGKARALSHRAHLIKGQAIPEKFPFWLTQNELMKDLTYIFKNPFLLAI